MSAALINTFTSPLACSGYLAPTIPSDFGTGSPRGIERKQKLRALLVSLDAAPARTELENCVNALTWIEEDSRGDVQDDEEEALKNAVTFKHLVNLYAHALDTYLNQAMQTEAEADWWKDIGRSRPNTLLYLLQTLPLRLSNLVKTVLHALHAKRLPFQLSVFSPTSLRQLFPASKAFQPGVLTTTLFPHLHRHPLSITASTILFSRFRIQKADGIVNAIATIISKYMHSVASSITLPMELGRQECEYKCKELERIRDQHAEILGRLAFLRGPLIANVTSQPNDFQTVVDLLERTVSGDEVAPRKPRNTEIETSALPDIARLSTFILSSRNRHEEQLTRLNLRRPSTLVRIWPKLFLLPPLCIFALRYLYTSRANIAQVVKDAHETVVGFIRGWLVEPLKDVLRTVRAGGEDGVIVRPEAVAADLDSLERMVLSLAQDELSYGPNQLQELSQKIRVGDLTPIMELYEEEIKHPLKSALLGKLLRSIFIQVQKAKVDIDQTLTGVDKLLKSQELTFAFVGVAPALAIVYLAGGSLVSLYLGERGRGKYGGKTKRAGVWNILRRTERLLVSQPSLKRSSHADGQKIDTTVDSTNIAPLTAGLLLLAVARLRMYAQMHLPVGSRVREGFLEDVTDLEDPDLGRGDKILVVDRMWRCWSPILGWNRATTLE